MTAVISRAENARLMAADAVRRASGVASVGARMSQSASSNLRAGDQAPPFTLPNQKGVPVSLEAALEKGPVLLGFHRGTW